MNPEEETETPRENKKFIVRDSEHTKYYLWNAYEGYEEHYGNYIMYERIGRAPITITAGLHKYMIKFYYQIKNNWKEFEKKNPKLKIEIKAYEATMKKEDPTKEDYTKIMDFIEKFMFISGVKNIIFKEENPGDSVTRNR